MNNKNEIAKMLNCLKTDVKKILWLSRHNPIPAQITELKRIFGGNTEIAVDNRSFANSNEIKKRYKAGGYSDIVLVAPLSVMKELIATGIKPLFAKMEICSNNDYDVEAYGRYYRFDRFVRVTGISIEEEELG